MNDEKNQEDIKAFNQLQYPKTDWELLPGENDLNNEIANAKDDYILLKERIARRYEAISGKYIGQTSPNRSKYKSRLIKNMNDWLQSSIEYALTESNTIIDTTPLGSKDKQNASNAKKILNKQFLNDIDFNDFAGKLSRKIVDEAIVFIKVGWRQEKEDVEFVEEEFIAEPNFTNKDEMSQAISSVQNGELKNEDIYQKHAINTKKYTEETIVFNGPTLDIVEQKDIMFSSVDNYTVIHRFETTYNELKESGLYSNLEKLKDVPTNTSTGFDGDNDNKQQYLNIHYLKKKFVVEEFWTLWDIHNAGELVPVVVSRVGNIIIRMEENPFPHKKPPFIMIKLLHSDKKDIYNEESPMDSIYGNQKVIGALTRGMIDIMSRSANGQRGVQINAITPSSLQDYYDGRDYFLNPGVDPTKAFYMHKYEDIPNSAKSLLADMIQNAESSTGIKSFNTGLSGSSFGNVATGVNAAVDAISKRESIILRRIGAGIIKIAKQFLEMSYHNLSDDEIRKILDDDSNEINTNILDGDFDISFSISTPEKDNEKAKDLTFMLQTMGNSIPQDQVNMLLAEYAELKKMPSLAKAIKEYQPKPDPVEQQKSQLEIQLEQMKIAKEQATSEYYQAMAKLNEMKISSEQGKAEVLKSDAALRNLHLVDAVEGKDVQKQKELDDHKFNLELGKMGASALLNAGSKVATDNETQTSKKIENIKQTSGSNQDPGMTDVKDIPSEAVRT